MEPLGKFLRVLNGVPRENIKGSPREIPRGTFNILPRDSMSNQGTSRGALFTPGLFTDFHSYDVLDQFLCSCQYCACDGSAKSFLQSGVPSVANALRPPVVSYTMLHSWSKTLIESNHNILVYYIVRMYTVHYAQYTVHSTLCTVHCTLYTLQCIVYTVHCKL